MAEIIRQSKDNTCVAAVLAMITNNTEQYVLDWFENQNPPFCDDDVIIFLAHHGIFFAACGNIKDHYENGTNLNGYEELTITYNLKTCTAYVVVESPTRVGLSHAVLLKKGLIYDPLHDTPQEIGKYKVFYFYPLLIAQEREPLAKLIK